MTRVRSPSITAAFWMWATTGALLAAGILAVFSFGLVLLPLAIVTGIVATRLQFWPNVLGAGVGIGCAVLWPAIMNWGVRRCEPIVSMSSGVLNGPGQVSQRCTSMDYQLWCMTGLATLLASIAAYRVTVRCSTQSTPTK
jgi:4-amino-4-deoxy-L-arabinose transferase-like glycosyltransferase